MVRGRSMVVMIRKLIPMMRKLIKMMRKGRMTGREKIFILLQSLTRLCSVQRLREAGIQVISCCMQWSKLPCY